MVERIRSRKLGGQTAFYDALGVYLDGAADANGRTILVIFTDGGDTRSTITAGDVAAGNERQLRIAYPAHPDDALAALTGTGPYPGAALGWAVVEKGAARLVGRR